MYCREFQNILQRLAAGWLFFALKGSRCTPSLNCGVADHKHNRSLNNQ